MLRPRARHAAGRRGVGDSLVAAVEVQNVVNHGCGSDCRPSMRVGSRVSSQWVVVSERGIARGALTRS